MKSRCQISSAGRVHNRSDRLAFTLIELLTVMGLMVILMVAGMAGYRGMRRGAELRGAEALVRSVLMLARQQAVTKHKGVEVVFIKDATRDSMKIFTGTNEVYGESLLPPSIEFISPPTSIKFGPAGSAGMLPFVDIKVREKWGLGDSLQTSTITVWPLTGVTKVGL